MSDWVNPAPHDSEDEALLAYLTAQAAAFDLAPLGAPAPVEPEPEPEPEFASSSFAAGVGWGLGGQAYFGGHVWGGVGVDEYTPLAPSVYPYPYPYPHPHPYSYPYHPGAVDVHPFYTAPPPVLPTEAPYAFLHQAPPLRFLEHLPPQGSDPFAGLYRRELSTPPPPGPTTTTFTYASTFPSTSSAFELAHLPATTNSRLPPPASPALPASPSTERPPSPSFIPLVSLGSSNRIISSTLPTPLAAKPGRKAPTPGGRRKAGGGSSSSTTKSAPSVPLELSGHCWTCGTRIARLVLRKPPGASRRDLEDLAPRATLTCPSCLVPAEVVAPNPSGGQQPKREPTYLDTFSAAIDRLEQIHLGDDDEVERRVAESLEVTPEAVGASVPLCCDVCQHIVGAGTVSQMTDATTGRANFTIEVLCRHCTDRYKPCSDCGSGGGRLTPGKWRCKELFPENRRTCRLLHTRNPPLADITYKITQTTDLNPAEIPVLEARCRQLYFQARLNEFARPESLEGRQELGRNFREIEQMTTDSWNLLQPLFREDIEKTRGIRRYLALQLARPHGRRSKDKANEADAPLMVTGFFLTELEFSTGAMFLCVAAPWSTTGQGFKSNTILGDLMISRCRSDLSSLSLPPLQTIWTIASFRRSSRLACSLLKRGFIYLEDECAKRPETDRRAFPPGGRDMWIPKQVMHAWEILVRYVGDGSMLSDVGSGA